MYKAIWTGRHGFHILFFSWESWTETWAQELTTQLWHIVDALF